MLSTTRLRNFVWTINNPTDKDLELFITCPYNKYWVAGTEKGKEGTQHLQGYTEFKLSQRFSTIQQYYPRAHIENRRGTAKQASDYCKKDGDFKEWGVMSLPSGKRTDIDEIKELVNEQKVTKMSTLMEYCNNFQQIKYAETLIKYSPVKRDWVPKVIWFFGDTGTGKTRIATEICEFLGGGTWMSGRDLKFWEGYDADECVILDDFRGDFCTYHELLRILDRYPYRINTKGSSRELLAKYIFITSPFSPRKCFQTVEDKGQLYRRISFALNLNYSCSKRITFQDLLCISADASVVDELNDLSVQFAAS